MLVREPGAAPGLPVVERIVPVVAQAAAADDAGGRAAARTAAAWYREHGPAAAAARELMRAGDRAGAAQVLREHGGRIVSGGHVALVVRLVGELPPEERDERLWLLLGDALRTSGDLGAAQRAYEEAAGTRRPLPAATAWRLGRVSYQRGDAHGALAAFARAAPGESGADAALLAAAVANARLLAGDVDDAVDSARHAVRTAAAAGDDAALAAAYLSLALCLGVAGDSAGSAEHFALALPMAQRTGDVLLLTQIHTNRSYQQLQQAHYAAALESAELCAVYAQAAGSPSLHAIATSNEADALAMLGRYDEAARRYRAAIAHYQRHGSRRFAGAVLGLAELYWRRGWREQARAAYEQVIEVASGAGNAHVLVPALAGLALTVLADDVKAAAGYAEAAVDQAGPELSRPGLLAQGWIALHQGAPVRAAELATEAARAARTRSEPAGLADALELRAAAEPDPHRARPRCGRRGRSGRRPGRRWRPHGSRCWPRACPAPVRTSGPTRCPQRSGWPPRTRWPTASARPPGPRTGRRCGCARSAGSRWSWPGRWCPRRRGSRARPVTCCASWWRGGAGRCRAASCASCCGPTPTGRRPGTGCRCCSTSCAACSTRPRSTPPTTISAPTSRASR
ncbi:hypothetical protein ACFQY4_27545 [Catellatospora bangladeshensis]|uniref:hypothetical protein n=1 Tax=Catellatospora bangladeshensis TaxID=310355 RepID=UPI0036091B0E